MTAPIAYFEASMVTLVGSSGSKDRRTGAEHKAPSVIKMLPAAHRSTQLECYQLIWSKIWRFGKVCDKSFILVHESQK